jgi:replicative DNA helicase
MEPINVHKSTIINLEKGKLPPQAIDLEMAILGAMLIDSRGQDEAFLILSSSDIFYKDAHKIIFEAMQNLYNIGSKIDLLIVSQELKRLSKLEMAGGDFYLIKLTQMVSSSAHVEYHARILLQHYMKRQVILYSSQNIALAYDENVDVFDLLRGWQKTFDNLVEFTNTGRVTTSFPEGLEILIKQVEFISQNKDEVRLVGVDTGFKRTNIYTGGYRKQNLIITAGRPAMGKTAKVLKTAIENVKKGVPVGFISGEMSADELVARCVAIDTNFHLNQLRNIGFSKPSYFYTLRMHIERMKNYPLFIDDSGNMDIMDVIGKAKQWKRTNKIELLIIDYIQLMKDKTVKTNQRSNELAEVSRRLKLLAKELDIPVIVLAQVNRDCEKRGSSKRPLPSDIKDCGAIEQDADIIEFIYRPSEYKIEMDSDEYSEDLARLVDMGANTEIIFAKFRGGAPGTTLLKWIGDKTKFIDVEDETDTAEYIEDQVELPKINPDQAFESNEDKDLPDWLQKE